MPTQKKEELVKKLTDYLTQTKGVVLVDYQGLNTAQLQEIREKLGEKDCLFQIIKNSLFEISLEKCGYPEAKFEGPTAAAFVSKDIFAALKILNQQIQTSQEPKIRAGFWEKELLNQKRLDQLVKIPSLKHLKGLVVSQINSPLTNLVYALNWNLNQLVFTLKQIQERG